MPSLRKRLKQLTTRPKQNEAPPTPARRVSRSTCQQLQSALFSKLPSEIRLLIYSYALPPFKNYHVEHQRLKTNRIPWPATSSEFTEKHAALWHYVYGPLLRWREFAWPGPQRLVPNLLFMCRRVYDEATDWLYSTRVFYFDAPTKMLQLHDSTPLHLFNRITCIRFVFCCFYSSPRSPINIETWTRALAVLKQMPNLQSFHILLSYRCWDCNRYDEEDYARAIENQYGMGSGTPLWFEWGSWNADARVGYDIASIRKYLGWVNEVPCKGEVVAQLIRGESRLGIDVRYVVTEMRLQDGEWVDWDGTIEYIREDGNCTREVMKTSALGEKRIF